MEHDIDRGDAVDRRGFIKKAGTVAWTVPAIQVIAPGAAQDLAQRTGQGLGEAPDADKGAGSFRQGEIEHQHQGTVGAAKTTVDLQNTTDRGAGSRLIKKRWRCHWIALPHGSTHTGKPFLPDIASVTSTYQKAR